MSLQHATCNLHPAPSLPFSFISQGRHLEPSKKRPPNPPAVAGQALQRGNLLSVPCNLHLATFFIIDLNIINIQKQCIQSN